MFRAYNPTADYHFFTISFVEFANAVEHGYRDETTGRNGFAVYDYGAPGTVPIHRMYNPNNGRHYYTLSNPEVTYLASIGWRYEKDDGAMYAAAGVSGATEIFRLYNNNSGVHLYTQDPAVKDSILQQFPGIWVKHDSVGFAYALSSGSSGAATAAAIAPVIATTESQIRAPLAPTVFSDSPDSPLAVSPAPNDTQPDSRDDPPPAEPIKLPEISRPSAIVQAGAAELGALDRAFAASDELSLWEA